MPPMIRDLVEHLRVGFDRHADPVRARSAAAYMRDQFEFYGIAAPTQRQIAREATAGLPPPSESELAKLAEACWSQPEREWQYFACGYLRKHVGRASPGLIDLARTLVTTKSWCDTVDSLASHTVGPLVRTHPELVATMDRWVSDENIWLARTAILHQLSAKQHTDPARLFRYCEIRATEKEFFLRKAIGWALREYSKTDGAAVRAFVVGHAELSGLSRTEALRWLERRAARSALHQKNAD